MVKEDGTSFACVRQTVASVPALISRIRRLEKELLESRQDQSRLSDVADPFLSDD